LHGGGEGRRKLAGRRRELMFLSNVLRAKAREGKPSQEEGGRQTSRGGRSCEKTNHIEGGGFDLRIGWDTSTNNHPDKKEGKRGGRFQTTKLKGKKWGVFEKVILSLWQSVLGKVYTKGTRPWRKTLEDGFKNSKPLRRAEDARRKGDWGCSPKRAAKVAL